MAKKRGGTAKALIYATIFAILFVVGYYLYFETRRIAACGVDIFKDWRSYIAFVLSKIPIIKEKVEYTPLKVQDPKEYYRTVLSGVVEDIGKKMKELEEEKRKVENMKRDYEKLLEVLKGMEEEWKKSFEEMNLQKREYENVEKRVEDLRRLMRSADPDEFASILVDETITPLTIAIALNGLPDDQKAEIIQALARKDPKKAAIVTAELGSVDVKLKEIKDEEERLRETLKEAAEKLADLEKKKILKSVIVSYISRLTSRDIVKMMMDLKLDLGTIAVVISNLPVDKAKEVLSILQTEHEDIFKKLVERGLGG